MATDDIILLSLTEGKRAPGSEWLKNHARLLEVVYTLSKDLIERVYPIMKRLNATGAAKFMISSEAFLKGWLFNCQMCGQCILHSTGMTCPMTCPKNLRNGPCGGVRVNGHCEVLPELSCVWVQAWERSKGMTEYGNEIFTIQPPINRALKDSSSWINMLDGRDTVTPAGWIVPSQETQ